MRKSTDAEYAARPTRVRKIPYLAKPVLMAVMILSLVSGGIVLKAYPNNLIYLEV